MDSFRHSLKLFATDLDGTVLIDRGVEGCHATPRIKAALRALQDSGVVVCLASGRMHESIRIIAAEMGIRGPIISYNGAMLRGAGDELLDSHTLAPSLAEEVVALAEDEKLPLNYYLDGVLYARRIQPWWDLYHGRTSSPMREVSSHRELAGSSPYKLLIYAEAARIRALRDSLAPRWASRCTLMITADEYLEILPLGADKGHSLAMLAGHLGLQPEQVVAAGDGWNDLGMLAWAGLGVAMESGREELRAGADCVVPGPEEDGLARFIEERLLPEGAARG
jgi:Cof subfamily protein (haloacid dehalogenase superfamily)